MRDDGSTDGTFELLGDLLADAPVDRVDLRRNDERLGIVPNVEAALAASTGDVVCLCDHDDVWLPEKLARVEAALDQRPDLAGVFSDAWLIDEDGARTDGSLWDAVRVPASVRAGERLRLEDELRWNVVTGTALAIRAEAKDLVLPLSRAMMHDRWIAILLSASGALAALPERLLEYRLHGANAAGVEASGLRARLAERRAQATLTDDEVRGHAEALARLAHRDDLLPGAQATLEGKLAFCRERAALPTNPIRRASRVASLQLRGDYRRWARGPTAAAYDLAFGGVDQASASTSAR